MDRIATSNKQVDKFGAGKHGFSAGNPAGGVPATYLSNTWCDNVQEELLAIIEGAGVAPDANTMNQVRKAIKRLGGGNVRLITTAGPTVLTADDAGVVIIDAGSNAVAVTMPAVNGANGVPLSFEFFRLDVVPANAVTVSRAGADVFAGGTTSFTLTSQNDFRRVVGDGTSKWLTTALPASGAAVGSFMVTGGTTTPPGYLLCPTAQTNISRTTYAALFAELGTTWGAGDGSTTFGMPWFPADYAIVQANGNVGTQTVGVVINHVHSNTSAAVNTSTTPGGAATTAAQTTANTGNPTAGGSANLPAGVRARVFVKY